MDWLGALYGALAVNYLTKHELKVAACVVLLFALGLAVKVYRTAHPADNSLSQSQSSNQSYAR